MIGARSWRASSPSRSTWSSRYYMAVVSFRFGLDPDNQSVPIITSVMDLAGVVCFLFVLSVFGVT